MCYITSSHLHNHIHFVAWMVVVNCGDGIHRFRRFYRSMRLLVRDKINGTPVPCPYPATTTSHTSAERNRSQLFLSLWIRNSFYTEWCVQYGILSGCAPGYERCLLWANYKYRHQEMWTFDLKSSEFFRRITVVNIHNDHSPQRRPQVFVDVRSHELNGPQKLLWWGWPKKGFELH